MRRPESARTTRAYRRGAGVATVLVACAAPALLLAPAALATSLPARTFDAAALAPLPAGASASAADPTVSADGAVIAFDSPVAGGGSEVFAIDDLTGQRALISTVNGSPAGSESTDPSLSANGTIIAFTSNAASSPPYPQAITNVYVRLASGGLGLVSAGIGGAPANGSSSEPVVSGNGDEVAFTSSATNLVPGDTSSSPQVFVRNLLTGTTTLVSAAAGGGPGNGWASNPSINTNGRYISFDSASTNLARAGTSSVPQVYLRDTSAGTTRLISVTSGGKLQNAADTAPFRQVSAISGDGSLVAFDSNASNLVLGDVNRSTDVFLRNVRRHRTTLISENNAGYEGNSVSFDPTFSANGTKVAFESYASNLARGGGPGANVFVRDLALGTTSVIDVGPSGQRPSREQVATLLQRPVLSGNGNVAVFESTAASLTRTASDAPHVFVRLMNPPEARFTSSPPRTVGRSSVTVSVGADDRAARTFSCAVNRRTPFACGPGRITFRHLHRGTNTLSIRAGGAGMLYQPTALTAKVTMP
jgi:Tol biopolymer transport system component